MRETMQTIFWGVAAIEIAALVGGGGAMFLGTMFGDPKLFNGGLTTVLAVPLTAIPILIPLGAVAFSSR